MRHKPIIQRIIVLSSPRVSANMAMLRNATEGAKNPLDTNSEKGRRGPKPHVVPKVVRGRADNYRVLLGNAWDRLWPQLSQAQTDEDVIAAFREVHLAEYEFMPHQ